MRIPRWPPKPTGLRWHARNDRAVIKSIDIIVFLMLLL